VWVCILSYPACQAHVPYHIICGLPQWTHYSTLSHKQHNFWKKVTKHEMCALTFSTILPETGIILRRIQQDIITNLGMFSCTVPIILITFQWHINFLDRLSEYSQISNVMKIHPVGASCSMYTDGQAGVTELIVALNNFANLPKNSVVCCVNKIHT